MIIITCGCGDTDSFAESAFRIIFPDTPIPEITHNTLSLTNPTHIQMVNALAKADKKYALLFTDEGVWDLNKGVQIQ